MIDLYLYNRKIKSIFDLLGKKENDISFSIGLGLSKSPSFLQLFLTHLDIQTRFDSAKIKIKLQQFETQRGFTDFEIEQEGEFSLIIEAKKGWQYPGRKQLDMYSSRLGFDSSAALIKKLVVFTEGSPEYTATHFHVKKSNDYEVVVVSYKELWKLAQSARPKSNNYEKLFLNELIQYLESVMTMQNIYSNKVFVVSLGWDAPDKWNINWQGIVNNKRRYFHPVGGSKGGWPSEPPNYVAFRYKGKLQSIHHVEKYEVFTNPNKVIKEIPSVKWEPHYLYYLGEPIHPRKVIKTGKIYPSGRVWAMLDLLLTCSTISEARDKTKVREQQLG